jgi:hypothetical protein
MQQQIAAVQQAAALGGAAAPPQAGLMPPASAGAGAGVPGLTAHGLSDLLGLRVGPGGGGWPWGEMGGQLAPAAADAPANGQSAAAALKGEGGVGCKGGGSGGEGMGPGGVTEAVAREEEQGEVEGDSM